MKFSRLSTIFFDDNDFQSKSPLDLPIVPRGEVFTFMELEEGFNISLLTAYPSACLLISPHGQQAAESPQLL